MKSLRIMNFFRSATARLALSYLAIIMAMSLSYSLVLYSTSTHEFDRQVPPLSFYGNQTNGPMPRMNNEIDQFLRQRIREGKSSLLEGLIFLNILMLLGGGVVSYYLARLSLRPIEKAMQSQSRFVSDASHELRTPLTAIQTANEVALRREHLSVSDAKKIIHSNVEEVTKLKTLTDGLLTLVKQDNQQIIATEVSLHEIASEALGQIVRQATQKKITVDDEAPDLHLLGDRQSLIQLLVILLDNAVKYSPENSHIHLTGFQKGKFGFLSVRDEGPGIRATDQQHIFERFYRANLSRSKDNHDGYGLGLSIAQKIAEQHHGKISVESTLGKGSTFTVMIPIV
jgi:signal transduction histidine kinase